MFLTVEQQALVKERYQSLKSLILKRMAYEASPAYAHADALKTDMNFPNIHGACLLHMAASVGDLEEVKALLAGQPSENINISFKMPQTNSTALEIALSEEQFDVAEALIVAGADLDSVNTGWLKTDKAKIFYTSRSNKPLPEDPPLTLLDCAENNSWEAAEVCLKQDADINVCDRSGKTAFLIAVENGHVDFAKQLLNAGANPHATSYFGDNAFHLAERSSESMREFLSGVNDIKPLRDTENIFGETPAQIKTDAVNYSQDRLIERFSYYLRLNYRDTGHLSSGYCSGLAFLAQYYDSLEDTDSAENIDTFWEVKKQILTWNGEPETLQERSAIFEAFLSSASWFQQSLDLRDIMKLMQTDRAEQMALFDQGVNTVCKAVEGWMSPAQIREHLTVFSQLPEKTRLEIGGSDHAISLKVSSNKSFKIYDANFKRRSLNKGFSPEEMLEIIVNTKYKFLYRTLANGSCQLNFHVFHFPWNKLNFSEYNYFEDHELPLNASAARLFQENSPNKLTHFHIAVMTSSLKNIKQLVQVGHVDVNAKDALDKTAFERAVAAGNLQACVLLLDSPALTLENTRTALVLYENNEWGVLNKLIQHENTRTLENFGSSLAEKHDFVLLERLLLEEKISNNFFMKQMIHTLSMDAVTDKEILSLMIKHKDHTNDKGESFLHKLMISGSGKSLS